MYRADVITLLQETPREHGLYDAPAYTEREVFARVSSVGMRESYEARSHGLSPEIRLTLKVAEDYEGERFCVWNAVRYKIIRTYVSGDGIELTCERVTDDV